MKGGEKLAMERRRETKEIELKRMADMEERIKQGEEWRQERGI